MSKPKAPSSAPNKHQESCFTDVYRAAEDAHLAAHQRERQLAELEDSTSVEELARRAPALQRRGAAL